MANQYQASQILINHILALPLNLEKKDLDFIIYSLFLAKKIAKNPTDEALFFVGAIIGTQKNLHVLDFLSESYQRLGVTSKDWLKLTHYAAKLVEVHNDFVSGKRNNIDIELEIHLETYKQMYEEFKKNTSPE